MSEDFAFRLANPMRPTDQNLTLREPEDKHWAKGEIIIMKAQFTSEDNNLIRDDVVLMDREMAERFIAAGLARFETAAEREVAMQMGRTRPGSKANKSKKDSKPAAKEE